MEIQELDVVTEYVLFRKVEGYGFVADGRKNARRFDLAWYRTSRPCSSGHYSVRSTDTGICLACEERAGKPTWTNKPQFKYEIEGITYYKTGIIANQHNISTATVKNRCESKRFKDWNRTRIEN